MTFTEMKIKGAWVHTPTIWPDERGTFHEVLKLSQIEQQLGRTFTVKQVNQSTSAKGVIRGIHYTDSPEGQAKYVSCPKGSLWDVVVDLRPTSPTYGQWDAAIISAENKKSILISEGLGHAFLSLEDDSTAFYLCSSEFNPEADKTVNVFSPTIGIHFDSISAEFGVNAFLFSDRDERSATL